MKKIINKILRKFGYQIVSSEKMYIERDPFQEQRNLITNREGLVIFDVGGHHGQTAIQYSGLFKNSTIYTFEPFPDSFIILKQNVNNYPLIRPFNLALGNSIGEVEFHINKYSATNSLLPTHEDGAKAWSDNLLETITTIKVHSTSIDDFLNKNDVKEIDILKMDTQGTEYYIIEGAAEAIKQNRIKLIYLEIITVPTYKHQKNLEEILSLLRLNNFELFNFYNSSLTHSGKLRQVDAIFLNRNYQFNI